MIKPLIKSVLVCINGSKASIQAEKYSIILAKQKKMNINSQEIHIKLSI